MIRECFSERFDGYDLDAEYGAVDGVVLLVIWMSLLFHIDVDGLLNIHNEAIYIHPPEGEQLLKFLISVQPVIVLYLRDVIAFEIVILNLLRVLKLA